MDRDLIQDLVRLKLKGRRLPEDRPIGFRETSGDGRPCDACGEPISPKQRSVLMMVSLEWMSVHFHVDCYKVWDAERHALSGKDSDDAGGHMTTPLST